MRYDRVGYGNAFNAVSVSVQNGVVTLAGHARTDVDRDSAMTVASTFPGVKDVNDEIEVDPTSMLDDQTRLRGGARHLWLSFAQQVRHRPRQADPHCRAERQSGAVRHGGLAG